MALNPISVNVENKSNVKRNPSFGNGNLVVTVMDAIDRGGFAASFVAQDMLGMAIPRTVTGLTRNQKDNGGQQNTAYARLVALREFLSGPSSFIIPAGMIALIKKSNGKANNVPVNFIKGFSDDFADFAENNSKALKDANVLKSGFYKHAVKKMLNSSLDIKLSEKDLQKNVDEFTDLLIKMDNAPKKYFWSKKVDANGNHIEYSKELKGKFSDKFAELRKSNSTNSSNKITKVWYNLKQDVLNTKEKSISTSVGSFIGNLRDFTDDISKSVNKKYKSGSQGIKEFVENFGHKRIGSRFLTNALMTVAVAMFFTIIPRIYNSKDGKNPALAGLEPDNSPHAAKKGVK